MHLFFYLRLTFKETFNIIKIKNIILKFIKVNSLSNRLKYVQKCDKIYISFEYKLYKEMLYGSKVKFLC